MSWSARLVAALLGVGLALVIVVPEARAGSSDPDDPVFQQGLQWGLDRIGAPQAWQRGTGDGITIAVVDSGVDLGHEDLADKVVSQVSCVGADGDPARCQGSAQDDNGHGSHVAGIALASTGNGRGIAGVAPDADLMAVRVLTNQCDGAGVCTASGTAADVAAGIRWAADHGADIINLSLGGGAVQGALGCGFCDAVEYAWSKGAIPVIAAGNDSVLPSGFGDEHAVVVTATTRDDQRASYSNASSGLVRNARWPISAPGGEAEATPSDCATGGTPSGVLSAYWVSGGRHEYACLAGTSMAAPHVAGSLAVLLALGRSPQAAIDQLLGTAEDLGAPGRDDVYGAGRLDLARAVGAPTVATSSLPPSSATSFPAGPPPTSAPLATAPPTPPPPSVPGETTTAPTVSLPIPSGSAAPFTPTTGPATPVEDPPGWLVAVAVGALLASGAATSTAAWRLRPRR